MVTVLFKMKKNMYYIASQPRSSLHWTILVLFCTMKYVSFNSFLNACSVYINANINSFYWLNYGHTSSNKGTSGFRSNTLLILIKYCYQFKYFTGLIKSPSKHTTLYEKRKMREKYYNGDYSWSQGTLVPKLCEIFGCII